jgi:hypothetical protein
MLVRGKRHSRGYRETVSGCRYMKDPWKRDFEAGACAIKSWMLGFPQARFCFTGPKWQRSAVRADESGSDKYQRLC